MSNKVQIELDAVRSFFSNLAFSKFLGLNLESLGDGTAVISIPYQEKLIGDPKTRVMHGGVVTALLDSCCGAAVMAAGTPKTVTATIDLRIDYMRPAEPNCVITATSECYHITKNVVFVSAIAHDSAKKAPVARATGAFTNPF